MVPLSHSKEWTALLTPSQRYHFLDACLCRQGLTLAKYYNKPTGNHGPFYHCVWNLSELLECCLARPHARPLGPPRPRPTQKCNHMHSCIPQHTAYQSTLCRCQTNLDCIHK